MKEHKSTGRAVMPLPESTDVDSRNWGRKPAPYGGGSAMPFPVLWLAMSLLCYLLGWNLRRFKEAGRRGTMISSCLGLLFFPLGTILNGLFLYVLISGSHLFNRLPPVLAETPKIVTGNS